MGNTSSRTNKPPDEPKLYTREEALQIYIEADNLQQARHLLIRNSHLLLLESLPQGFDNNIAHELWTFTGKKKMKFCQKCNKNPHSKKRFLNQHWSKQKPF
jgi:hypothetical protein